MFYKDTIIRDVWPCFVRPKEDELLSSWLFRNAYAHGVKPYTLCRQTLGVLNVWHNGLDKSVKLDFLQTVASKCDTSLERAKQTTLASYGGIYFEDYQKTTITKGILAWGTPHHDSIRYAQQFCPSCLKKDGDAPYFRKKWRFSTSIVCTDCYTELQDCCPACRKPICYHKRDQGYKNASPILPISSCFNCGYQLVNAESIPAEDLLLRTQQHLDAIAQNGFLAYQTYPFLYFRVFYQLCHLMTSRSRKPTALQKLICRHLQIPFEAKQGGCFSRFDFLRHSERKVIIPMVVWFLDEWPGRFIACCKESSCFQSTMFDHFKDVPYWYWQQVMEHLFVQFSWPEKE